MTQPAEMPLVLNEPELNRLFGTDSLRLHAYTAFAGYSERRLTA